LYIYFKTQNQKKLRSAVQSTDIVSVMRSPDLEESVSSADLVPGDLVVIPPGGCELNFDGVLISGNAIGLNFYRKSTYVKRNRWRIPFISK